MRLSVERHVPASPSEVFARATDLARAPQTISAIMRIELLTEGSVGVGTRFRETRRLFGREATEEMEITAFDPPHGYELVAHNCGCRYDSAFRFAPDEKGTLVTMSFRATPLTFAARLMGWMSRFMQKSMARAMTRDLDDLARSFQSSSAAEAEAGA